MLPTLLLHSTWLTASADPRPDATVAFAL